MTDVPPAWGRNLADALVVEVQRTTDSTPGTTWQYGCGWCGRSTRYDAVEYCETVGRVVHNDCHDSARCRNCAELICTDDRCTVRDECEGCAGVICKPHGVTECVC